MPRTAAVTASAAVTDSAAPVTTWQGPIKVDLSSWETMGPILKWQEAARNSDFMETTRIMSQVVKSWPSEHDPAVIESYSLITYKEWQAAAQEVGKAISAFFQE